MLEENFRKKELIRLVCWDVVELGLDLHIIGFDLGIKNARFSTPVVELDLHKNRARTRSGSEYLFASAPGQLHPYAKALLKKIFNNRRLTYTLKFSHPSDNNLDEFDDDGNKLSHQARKILQKDPYDDYKIKLTASLSAEFEKISKAEHRLSWIGDRCIYIGNANDDFTLWNEFALRHQHIEEVQNIFIQQDFINCVATHNASLYLVRGELSKVVIDPEIPIIFSKNLWDEVCLHLSEMRAKLSAAYRHDDLEMLVLSPPSDSGLISWSPHKSTLSSNFKPNRKSPVESFHRRDYISKILELHRAAMNKFRKSEGLLGDD